MSFMIAAAGTGGHVFPGLSVGEALAAEGVPKADVTFVGGDRLEAEVYPREGFPFLRVELAGLKRSLTLDNLRIPGVVVRARSAIASEIASRGVLSVLGMGGYVTIPAGLAARKQRVVFFNSEQNAEAGLANRVSARWARASFTSFPETRGLPGGEWVGNPLRERFWSFDRDSLRGEALAHYGLGGGDTPVLGVVGGSLGAGAINDAVASMLRDWEGPEFAVIHLTGSAHLEAMAEIEASPAVTWRRFGFEERMDLFYAACDMVVTRAGGAVAELTATSIPSILVPGSFGSGSHQADNAHALQRAGAARVLQEERLPTLPGAVTSLLFDPDALAGMAQATAALAKPDAARTIARRMIEAAA